MTSQTLTASTIAKASAAPLDGSEILRVVKDAAALQASIDDVKSFTLAEMKRYMPTPQDFGAVGDGETDDSDAFNEATEWVGVHGGGELFVPPGQYVVQDVALLEGVGYRGAGQLASILRLPDSPSATMFKAGAVETFDGGGFFGLQLDGGGTTDYNAIDFSAVTTLEVTQIVDCFIHHFNKAYRGSGAVGAGNDRFPVIDRCRIWYNVVGLYINEHTIVKLADVRANDIGIQGRINDCQFLGTRINYNRIGLGPDGTNRMTNSTVADCTFYKNSEVTLDVGQANTIIGNYLVGTGSGCSGVILNGTRNQVLGNRIGLTVAGNSFGDGAVRFAFATSDLNVISGNVFVSYDGPCITADSSVNLRVAKISENTFFLKDNPAISLLNAAGCPGLSILDNTIHFTGTLAGDLVDITQPSVGMNIIGNHVFNEGGSITAAFGGSLSESTFALNRLRNSGAATGVLTDATLNATSIVRDNFGYKTAASGTTTVTSAATSVTVTHGLARTPAAKDIMVTPTNSTDAAKFWVSDVGATTFKINVDAAPGGSGATFGWRADIL